MVAVVVLVRSAAVMSFICFDIVVAADVVAADCTVLGLAVAAVPHQDAVLEAFSRALCCQHRTFTNMMGGRGIPRWFKFSLTW